MILSAVVIYLCIGLADLVRTVIICGWRSYDEMCKAAADEAGTPLSKDGVAWVLGPLIVITWPYGLYLEFKD